MVGVPRIESNRPVRRTRTGCLARGNPRPRKYPPEYPRSGLAKSPAFSRVCEKYPQYPQYPRDVGDAGDALSHAWRSHARKGAPGDVLSPTVWMAVFSRFGGPNTLPKPPKKGRFGALSDGASNRPVRHTRGVSCAWKPQVPTRSAFDPGSQVPHNPQEGSKALVSSFLTREFT